MAGMFYTWGHLDAPCMFRCHMHSDVPICSNILLYVPSAPLCICMFWGYLHVIGGCGGLLLFGCLPMCPTPQHIICSPACLCSRDYSMHYGGNIPYVGGWGAPAYLSGLWCLSVHPLWSIMLHLVPFL